MPGALFIIRNKPEDFISQGNPVFRICTATVGDVEIEVHLMVRSMCLFGLNMDQAPEIQQANIGGPT